MGVSVDSSIGSETCSVNSNLDIVHPSHTLDSLKLSCNTLKFDYPHLELYQGSVSHQGPPLSHHQHTPGSACSVPAEHIVHTTLPAIKLNSIELSWVLH